MSLRLVPRIAPLLVVSLCATSLAACALFGMQEAPDTSRPIATSIAPQEPKPARSVAARAERRPQAPHADGQPCVEGADCMARLRRMVANPDRSWIGRPEPPPSFANGTRLFAYRALRAKLSCRELALAQDDVTAATRRLAHSARGLAPDRVQKATALATDVAGELGIEHDSRCRTPTHGASATRNEPVHSQ